ncbi:deoxycytidylate deaminase [Trichomonascus vanleenenianus]|uniref:deoxycytidine monophosphate deaminase n=1 Tax=Trichomonascus vanleenenianus TaxID=2268995 RepID=UPI003ECA12E1
MLIGISGNICSGKSEVAKYLTLQGFTRLRIRRPKELGHALSPEPSSDLVFETVEALIEFVTVRWREDFVLTNLWDPQVLSALAKRPFFLHVHIDAPLLLRYERYRAAVESHQSDNEVVINFEEFVHKSDTLLYEEPHQLAVVANRAVVILVNHFRTLKDLYLALYKLNLRDSTRLRPSWDSYFMHLANLAALRSNCMKRQVGCVLVRDKRVIATGYNGTPRGLMNCNEGGCPRCNSGNGSGIGLMTCLCLHAEENALLEAGRDRIAANGVLYCNTCPCLTCSIKIAQCGIKEVVYSQSYSMDEHSAKVLQAGGVILRQFIPPTNGVVL